jgi:integrase
MRLVIDLAYMLGLREQELMYSMWSDIDWDHALFRVQAKKGDGWEFMPKDKEQRELGIPAVLLKRLEDHRAKQPKDTRLILATDSGKPNTHLLRTLKRLAQKAGLNCNHCESCLRSRKPVKEKSSNPLVTKVADPFTGQECEQWELHKFRRSFLTKMLRNGIDARTVQAFAGHSSLDVTLRYLRPASATEMQTKLNAIFAD